METKPKTQARAAVLGCALIVGAAASSALAASNHYVIRSWDYPAGSSNRLFIGAAVGDFNDDAVAEIALLKRAHSQIAIVRATFDDYDNDDMEAVAGFDVDLTNNQLIAVTACNLRGNSGGDELIVLRNAPSAGVSNLLVYRFGLDQDWSRTLVDDIRIGPGNSVWKGVACADFNGDGKPDIAVAEENGGLSNVYLFELSADNLVLKATNAWFGNMPLTSIAAGDLDGDNRAELVVARQASGNDKDFAFFKVDSAWGLQAAGAFNLAGGSTHYPWRGVAVGEFDRNRANGKEVVFYKSVAQHFHYAKYRGATTTPLAIGSSNFDTETSHPWTGMAVGEIVLSNGFDEMALVRQKPGDETLTLVGDEATTFNEKAANMQRGGFVFGAFNQALPGFRTQANTDPELSSKLDVRALKAFLENNHIPAFTFYIADIWNLAGVKPNYTVTTPGREYESMLEFLDLLKSTHSPIKVTALLTTREATNDKPYVSSLVRDTNYINEAELAPLGMGLDETELFDLADHNPERVDREDYEAWFSLLGAIGNKYPNLVGIAFDDFNGDAGVGQYLNPRTLGKMIERLRKFNDKIAFLPVVYYATVGSDDHRVLRDYTDGFLMYTRNDSQADPNLLVPPDEINPCACKEDETPAQCTARCDARANLHGAVVLEPETIAGGMGYDSVELGDFRAWMGTPYKFLLQGIYAETVTRSRTLPTPFTVGAQLNSARVNADLNGLTVYTTPEQGLAMGNTVYSRFASWFLVDDYFNQTSIGSQPSGWTISTLGSTTCSVEADPNNAFDRRLKFTDSSTVTAASARKNFTSQTGSLTAEWKFMQFSFRPQTMYLRQGTTDAIKIYADGSGGLYYAEPSSNRFLRLFATNTWYTVKVVANIAARTSDIYVNGTLHASGVAFSVSTTTALDNIYFATSPGIGSGSYIQYVDAVSITK